MVNTFLDKYQHKSDVCMLDMGEVVAGQGHMTTAEYFTYYSRFSCTVYW